MNTIVTKRGYVLPFSLASILRPRASISLKRSVEMHGLFGRTKIARHIGVSLDDPECLKSAIVGLSQSR